MIDHATISGLLDELEDEDSQSTGKKGLALVKGDDDVRTSAKEPAEGGDKLAELVAALSPEEKARLRTLLDASDTGKASDASKAEEPEEGE